MKSRQLTSTDSGYYVRWVDEEQDALRSLDESMRQIREEPETLTDLMDGLDFGDEEDDTIYRKLQAAVGAVGSILIGSIIGFIISMTVIIASCAP